MKNLIFIPNNIKNKDFVVQLKTIITLLMFLIIFVKKERKCLINQAFIYWYNDIDKPEFGKSLPNSNGGLLL